MKKSKLLITFLILFLGFKNQVYAGVSDNGGGGTNNNHGACPTCKMTYSTNGYGYGIRLTLVDSNGNRIANTNSYDFMSKALAGTVYSVSNKLDRYEVVNSSGVSFSKGYNGYSVIGNLPAFINEGKNKYIAIRDFIKNSYLVNSSGNINETGTNQLLQYLGSTYDEFLKECNTSIYLAIETIVVLRNSTQGSYYVGTVSELANWEYHNNGALSGVKSVFTDGTFPLSLYSESDLAGSQKVNFYTKNSNIFNDMNKKSGNLIPGYGLFLFHLSDEIPGCNEPPGPTLDMCDFSLDIKIPEKCTTNSNSSEGYIKDTENWECIYMSTLASTLKNGAQLAEYEKIANHFYEWENNYCAVYCREWVEYSLPGSNMTVLAGTHFVLGNSYIQNGPTNFILPRLNPITFTGRSECRVTSTKSDRTNTNINYDKFRTDYANADKTVKEKWDDWQIAIKKDSAVASSTNVSNRKDCNWTCDSTVDGVCVSGSYKNHNKKPATVYYNNGISNANVTPSNYCDNSTPKYVTNQKSLYNNAVNARDNILKQVKDCNNFVFKNKIFEPEVDFNYEEPVYGRSINNLDYNLNINTQTNYYAPNNAYISRVRKENVNFGSYTTLSENSDFVTTSANNGSTSQIAKYKCDTTGSTCYLSSETYPSNSWLKQWTTKTYNYKLPNGIYQNLTKFSGESYNYISEVGTSKNSINITYSNLPVHYSTKTGKYDYKIKFDTLGTQSATNKHKFDYYIFGNGKIGQTFGQYYDVYYLMLNLPNLSSKLAHCNQADHLGHGLATQLQKEGLINDFLNSSCAVRHHCYQEGSNIVCNKYQDNSGNWRTYSPGWQTPASYTTYNQVVSCIQQYAIKENGEQAFAGTTNYECTYNVKNSILTECKTPPCSDNPSDLNVVFRAISLDNPFPGINGNGRDPGENWNKINFVKNYITNNRQVTTEKVYKELDPLYTIILTPGLIKQIRNYNDKMDTKDVSYYTTKSSKIIGKAGYSDFNLECDEKGKNCKSNFIRNSVEGYNFSKYFSGCGISGKSYGLKCNSSENW